MHHEYDVRSDIEIDDKMHDDSVLGQAHGDNAYGDGIHDFLPELQDGALNGCF